MKMLKMLVCDDEKWIREGISTVIDWASMGIEKVLQARNGKQAADLVKTEKPDIIITDIRMPDLSGLDLIEKIKDSVNPKCIIVISGFSDFKYARASIQFGVSDYLLKPIDEKSLREAVQKCLNARKDEESRSGKLRQAAIHDLANWLNHGAAGSFSPGNFGEEFGIDEKKFIRVKVCRCRRTAVLKNREAVSFRNGVLESAAGNLAYLLFRSGDEDMGLLFSAGTGEEVAVTDLFAEGPGDYAVGEGEWVRTEEAWVSGRQSFQALQYALLYPDRRLFRYGELAGRKEKPLDAFEEFHLTLPVVLLANRRYVKYKNRIDMIFKRLEESAEEINPEELLNFFTTLVHTVGHLWNMDRLECHKFCDELASVRRRDALYKKLALLPQSLDLDRRIGINRNFLQALEYIEKNYSEPLTMARTAAALELNPSYFSRMFSRCAGESFMKHLTRLRMEKAKMMLRLNNEKIYEIAEKVGYADYRIFSKHFREYSGVSPADYRNNII
ncbi:MAG: response regulator [Treponema sp.]|jgi:two-component system response regulator YesN|nr:response regulator [Treponema sp.]